jgi:hypothetical protein
MEKKLGEIDKRKDDADKLKRTAASLTEMDKSETLLLPKRQSVFRRQNTTQPVIAEKDNRSKHFGEIGKKVARDFGKAGVFIGEIVDIDYDSEDVDKEEPVYVVVYTDGDREDMDHDEFAYAHEFHLARLGIDLDNESDASGSNDEESYRPSPKVNHNLHHPTQSRSLLT